jgi:DNA-binding transcriptional LysR family regulator
VELRHLRYFLAIAEAENVTRAAHALRIAQPALSQRMRDLEAELGVALFERQGRGIRLTQAGRYYQEEVRQTLDRLEAAGRQARQIERGEVGSLRVAILESLSLAGPIPRILEELRLRHPGLHLKLVGLLSQAQFEGLRARSIDCGFIAHRAYPDPDILGLPFMEIPIHAILPASHPLAGRASLRLADLEDLDFIWPEAQAGASYWNVYQEAFQGRSWRPRVVQEANSYVTTLGLVAAGFGCALAIAAPGGPTMPGIVQIPLQDVDLRLRVELVWHKDNPSPALRRFLEVARAVSSVAAPG